MREQSTRQQIGDAMAAYLRTDATNEIAYPMAVVFGALGRIMPVLITFFIAELVGDNEAVGGDYFTYAVIGLSVAAVLQGALTGFSSNLQRAQNRGQLEILLVEPVSWNLIPHYMSAFHLLMALVYGLVIFLVGLALGAEIMVAGIPAFVGLVLLGMVASHAIGILAGSLVVLSKRSAPLLQLYGLVASLLGGALFSVDQLPTWLRFFSYLIPNTYVITGSRTALMEDPGTFTLPPYVAVGALLVFALVLIPLSLLTFQRATRYAQRSGMLGGY